MTAGKLAWIPLAILASICLTGCQDQQQDDGWTTVDASNLQGNVALYRDIRFQDIPIPNEYTLLSNESFSFQSSLFRNGIIKYEGPLGWTDALYFFREEMPKAGWQLQKTESGYNSRALYFLKGPETLIVVVRQIKNGSRAELQLDNSAKNDLLLKGKLQEPKY